MKVVEHCPPYTLAYYYDKSCSTSAAIYPNEDRTLKVLIGSLTTVINGTEAIHTKGAVSRTQCMRPDPVTGTLAQRRLRSPSHAAAGGFG